MEVIVSLVVQGVMMGKVDFDSDVCCDDVDVDCDYGDDIDDSIIHVHETS